MKNLRIIAVFLLAAIPACDSIPDVREPEGEVLLPDLAPRPPVDLRIRFEEGGPAIRFSSTLVNVGDGDFVVRAKRDEGSWSLQQEVPYSNGGAELVPTEAELHWGGDGHDHWHIKRVVTYTLFRRDDTGTPIEDDIARPDAKIGFCFYDHSEIGTSASGEGTYVVEACGEEDTVELRMGMSPGWSDIYGFALPGQSIDIAGLEDGPYRVVAEADPLGLFREVSTENNITWIDFELLTRDGNQFAVLTEIGPDPADQ